MVEIIETDDYITIARKDGITFKIGLDFIDVERNGKLFDLFFFKLPAN